MKIPLSKNSLEILLTAVIAFFFARQFGSSPLTVTIGTLGLVIAIPVLVKKPEYAVFFLVAFFPFRDIHLISFIFLKRFCIWSLFFYAIIRHICLNRIFFTSPLAQFTKAAMLFVLALSISLAQTASELYSTHYITSAMLKSALLSDALVILEEILVVYIVYYFLNSFLSLQQVIDVVLVSSGIVAILGIGQYYLGDPPPIISFLFDPEYQFYGRATSVFSNPNGLGGFLASIIVIAFISLIWNTTSMKKRIFFILPVLLFDSWALILSFSRSAILQVLFGIVVTGYIYYSKICHKKLTWKTVGVFILIAGLMFSTVSLYDIFLRARLKFYTYNEYQAALNWLETTSDFRRKHAIVKAFQTFLKHPVLGIGYNLFSAKREAGIEYFGLPVHNQYMKILAEMGLIGFVPFIILLVIVLRTALKTWNPPPEKQVEHKQQIMMFLFLAAFSTIAFGNLFGDPLPIITSSGYFWLYTGAIFALERQFNESLCHT